MKIGEHAKLGECAICSYSDKKQNKKLRCHWDDDKSDICSEIKVCGSFPNVKREIAELKV